MKLFYVGAIVLCVAWLGCEKDRAVVGYGNQEATGNLTIVTDRAEYIEFPAEYSFLRSIQGTLVNNSSQTYYARLGAREASGGIDQGLLLIAEGSSGIIEKLNPYGSWSAIPRGIVFGGVCFVALRPSKTYRLIAAFPLEGTYKGIFRIKVEYFDGIEPPQGRTPMVDYSNVFTIC